MLTSTVFVVARIILFFISTYLIYVNIQAVDLSKVFKANSGDQIRFLYAVISVILGYLFTDALISLFEHVNTLL